jgi:Uma2 family endonuclease
MTPIGDAHAACVIALTDLLTSRLAGRALVAVQNPIALPRSRPYPDVAVLRRRPDYYRSGKPGSADISLIIEVADTSLARDRNLKLPLYGAAGIRETWIVDLNGGLVIVGTRPGPEGYALVRLSRRDTDRGRDFWSSTARRALVAGQAANALTTTVTTVVVDATARLFLMLVRRFSRWMTRTKCSRVGRRGR